MGVKWTLLGLNTQYPTNADAHKETTDRRTAKMLEAFVEELDPALVNKELPKEISKGTQSQLIEKCPEPCHGVPSRGYQNATAILLDPPIVN